MENIRIVSVKGDLCVRTCSCSVPRRSGRPLIMRKIRRHKNIPVAGFFQTINRRFIRLIEIMQDASDTATIHPIFRKTVHDRAGIVSIRIMATT